MRISVVIALLFLPVRMVAVACWHSISGTMKREKPTQTDQDSTCRMSGQGSSGNRAAASVLANIGSILLLCSPLLFAASALRVWQLSAAYPDVFMPVASVHPYRPDAVQQLERWAGKGARMIKWLPNSSARMQQQQRGAVRAKRRSMAHTAALAFLLSPFDSMGINPSSPLCAPFYAAMRRLGLVLLTHTGVEHSVDAGYKNGEQ